MKTGFLTIGIATTLYLGIPYAIAIFNLFSQVNKALQF